MWIINALWHENFSYRIRSKAEQYWQENLHHINNNFFCNSIRIVCLTALCINWVIQQKGLCYCGHFIVTPSLSRWRNDCRIWYKIEMITNSNSLKINILYFPFVGSDRENVWWEGLQEQPGEWHSVVRVSLFISTSKRLVNQHLFFDLDLFCTDGFQHFPRNWFFYKINNKVEFFSSSTLDFSQSFVFT